MKKYIDSAEKYKLLDKLNLCHRCEKNKQMPNKKFCPDCLEKIAEYNAKHYDAQAAHEYQKRRREIYREKKQHGICVRCTKKSTHGIYCYEHYVQAKRKSLKTAERRKRERAERGLIPQERLSKKLCLRCGNPVDITGYKMCNKCIEQNRKNSALADKSFWRKIENLRYEQCRRKRNDKV